MRGENMKQKTVGELMTEFNQNGNEWFFDKFIKPKVKKYICQCKECRAECIVITKDNIVSAEFSKLSIKCNAKFKVVK